MVEQSTESEFIAHQACEKCGSSDACAVYDDGHSYCFSCNQFNKSDEDVNKIVEFKQPAQTGLISGIHKALPNRALTLESSRKWNYQVGEMNGQPVQIANYTNDSGDVVAQKIRFPNKDFRFIGETKKVRLFGQNLWKDGGKKVIITEGEIDAISLSQVQSHKWPVVSVPNGAAGAPKAIRNNLEWLLKFETIVFMFDNDEVGRAAAKESAALLPPKRAKIATLEMKDANEMVVAGKTKELLQAMWDAKTFHPDGIVAAADLWDKLKARKVMKAWEFPFPGMNQKLLGMRRGEITTITAGSGVGKSAFCREIAYKLMTEGTKVGYIALEEADDRTLLGFMGIHANQPLHMMPDIDIDNYRESFDAVKDQLFLYDHWGSTESGNLLDKIRFLVRGCECDVIILDHLSMVVSGISADEESDERRLIDNTMTKLRTLTEELQCAMVLVSHLRRPQGDKGYERGQETSLNSLRGSAAIAQLSDAVVGLERDQQGEDPNLTTVRVLKNRYTGETGVTGTVAYKRETGRLREIAGGNQGVSTFDFAVGQTDGEF